MKYLHLLLIVFLFSCSNEKKPIQENSKAESRIEDENYYDLNAQVTVIDTNLNPFKNGLLFRISKCKMNILSEQIKCIINKFPFRNFPMHFGPNPEISLDSDNELNDSLFIVEAMKDTNYFVEEERQYIYYNGINISHNFDFYLVLIPTWFSVGKEYNLYTITKSGLFIDKLSIGYEFSDHESKFGKIESVNDIEVTTKQFGYDEVNDVYFFDASLTEKYYLNSNGKFIKSD